MRMPPASRVKSAVSRRSGATYSILYSPMPARWKVFSYSSGDSIELMHAAGMPMAVSAVTWSFISEMSGDTTSVSPFSISAGSW